MLYLRGDCYVVANEYKDEIVIHIRNYVQPKKRLFIPFDVTVSCIITNEIKYIAYTKNSEGYIYIYRHKGTNSYTYTIKRH
jgi:hypothetical protein